MSSDITRSTARCGRSPAARLVDPRFRLATPGEADLLGVRTPVGPPTRYRDCGCRFISSLERSCSDAAV